MRWLRNIIMKNFSSKNVDPVTSINAECSPSEDKTKFDHIMRLAMRLPKAARYNLLRALVRPMQSDYLLAVAAEGQDARLTLDERLFFFEGIYHYISFEQLSHQKLPVADYPLSLASDMVLPWPWSMNSYTESLNLGSLQGTPWHFDSSNHHIAIWLPWRVGFVKGGNHSLAAGILAGEGKLLPEEVFDMQDLLARVSTDGTWWYGDGKRVEKVRDWRTAAFFEIGRLVR